MASTGVPVIDKTEGLTPSERIFGGLYDMRRRFHMDTDDNQPCTRKSLQVVFRILLYHQWQSKTILL